MQGRCTPGDDLAPGETREAVAAPPGIVAVIPAAGRGTRAYPYTSRIPKCLLDVDGEPILARTLALLRDEMGIRDVVIVVGELGGIIRDSFGDGSSMGVRLRYVHNADVDRGLGHSLVLARPYVGEHFVVILSDECYLESNHRDLLRGPYRDYLATCAVAADREPEQVAKNYAVGVENGRIVRIVEKPRDPGDALLGLGTFVFHRRVLDHIEAALASPEKGPADPVSVLGRLCERGERIAPFPFVGRYVNVNDRDELNLANYLSRARGFESRPVSVAVVYRHSLAETLRTAAAFGAHPRIGQTVVALPPGVEPGADLPPRTEAIHAPSDRYGDLLLAGLDASSGEILIAVEGDGSSSPRDVSKFLEYLKDADLVVGTRTTRQLIHQGTNMRGVVRLAHVWLAKLLELVWWGYEPRLTDLGCTYRAIWRSAYRLIRPRLLSSGPEASVEMLVETLRARRRLIEIPVSFALRRPGLHRRDQTVAAALAILRLIVARRMPRIALAGGRYPSPPPVRVPATGRP